MSDSNAEEKETSILHENRVNHGGTYGTFQLHQFRARRTSASEVLSHGVWSWCRHPNYLGEIGFWCGVCLFGVAAAGGKPTGTMQLGPIAMVLLFVMVSIPMIDRKLIETKPDYTTVKQQVFSLLPFSALLSHFISAGRR